MAGLPMTYRFGAFALNLHKRELTHGDGDLKIPLQPKMFDTLAYLLRHAERVVPKDELLDEVWPDTAVTENVLTRVISGLRKALDDPPSSSRYIRSVPRVGYRFVGELSAPAPEEIPTEIERTVAVLPFQPLSESESERDETLELGLAETLVSRLSDVPGILVRPLSTVRAVVGSDVDALVAADRLRVDACVEGSIQRQGDQVRVTTRLVSADRKTALWSGSYSGDLSDIFALQDELGRRIIEELAPQLGGLVPAARPTSPSAYKAYLEGRLFLERHTAEDVARALERFESALDQDPAYAAAWASLAECHDLLGTIGNDPPLHYRAAARASQRALALEPGHAQALGMQAKIAWQFEWDWERADAIFRDAIERHPHRSDLHISYSDCCCYIRKGELAIHHARKALDIDPVSPWNNTLLIQALYMNDRYDEAIAQGEATLELAPSFPFAHFFLGLARFVNGDREGGLSELEEALSSRSDFVAAYGMCLALAGRPDEASRILAGLESEDDRVPPIAPAILNLALGNVDAAMVGFDKCFSERDWHVLLLSADPAVKPLTQDPKVRALVERLRLPESAAGDRHG